MDIAKSMYKGGIIVYADDEFLSHSSYLELGLACLGCNEEVNFRDGRVRRRHFAHFHAISENHKNCKYRVNAFSKRLGGDFTTEDRDQRREIFQSYLIGFIIISHGDFLDKLGNLKFQKISDLFVEECVSTYNQLKYGFVAQCRLLGRENLLPDEIAHKLVAGEVLDYLGIVSSKPVLRKIIVYSIFKILETSETDNPENISKDVIADYVRTTILTTSWSLIYKNISTSDVKEYLIPRVNKIVFLYEEQRKRQIKEQKKRKIKDKKNEQRQEQQNIEKGQQNTKKEPKRQEHLGQENLDLRDKEKKERLALEALKDKYREIVRKEILDEIEKEDFVGKSFKKKKEDELYLELRERYQGILKSGYPVRCPDCCRLVRAKFFKHVKNHYRTHIDAICQRSFDKYINERVSSELNRRIKLGIISD